MISSNIGVILRQQNPCLQIKLGWDGRSVKKVLALPAWGSESGPQNPCEQAKEPGIVILDTGRQVAGAL